FFIHLIYRKAEGRVWKKASLYGYVIAAVTGFCFVGLQVPLYKWYNEMAGTSLNIVFDFDGWEELRNINMLSVIFFIPVSEELFFRRWIQDKLQEVSQPYTGLLIATILFSSIHLGLTQIWLGWEMLDWHGAFITFWGGGIAGWLYMKFQSVGPSIIFHMCWNFMVVIV
ncbi:MAG: CPBP family intramembrane glutamic endopeptidase, partial [Bacteroidota bacterium]